MNLGLVQSLSKKKIQTRRVLAQSNIASNDTGVTIAQHRETAHNYDGWEEVTVGQRQFDFTGSEKILFDVPTSEDNKTWPIDIYNCIITDDLLIMISTATNNYTENILTSQPITRRSRLSHWHETSPAEIRKFVGIILYMGLVHKSEIYQYWSKSVLYNDQLIPSIMTRERFELLWGMIHFSDHQVNDESSRLHKIEPLITHLLTRYQAMYEPGENIVLDESMVPFRGRLLFRQYLPGKAHKYGIKLSKLCTIDAFTWNIKVYCGANAAENGLSSTETLTVTMCDGLLGTGRTLFADNYYSSVPLAEHLLSKRTYYCGTIRSNRKHLAQDIAKAKLKRGEMKCAQNGKGVKFYKWMDKRNVLTVSTIPEHGSSLVPTGKKTRNGENIMKPPSVLAYNHAKKGVDVSDQLSAYYSVMRKSKKWYRKLAFELVCGTSVVNAQILYNKCCPDRKMNLRKFTESLALSIMTGHPSEDIPGGKRSTPISGNKGHRIVEADGPKRKSRKRCKGCYEKISVNEGFKIATRQARKVSTYCADCVGEPYLCLPCFDEKHANISI